ncbi:DUF7455 domain-containing protein [Arthrobacter sp. USHLN218]|uniref:DUF7455 domain-containing protein n=1 Tax=Arthrobacter sp. USHLN218 TaxID=3081232 RepID=UPI0030187489
MHCDRCGALAYVHVTLDAGLTLDFCGHDYAANEEALMPYATEVIDERHLLHT